MKSSIIWFKGFASGVMISLAISAGIVYAAGGSAAITACVNNALHITYNGGAFEPAEADGSEIPPILYNGRTYLPVRAVAERSGIYVDYDDKTSEVILKSENELLNRANLALHY
jgi:hypothetical protein